MGMVTEVLNEKSRSGYFLKGKLVTDWSYNCPQKGRKPKWMVYPREFQIRFIRIMRTYHQEHLWLSYRIVHAIDVYWGRTSLGS